MEVFKKLIKRKRVTVTGLMDQVLDSDYSGTTTKSGFWRTTTVKTWGCHQASLPTILSADTLRDVNANGGPLVMRSSILKVLDAELQSDLIQETTYLHHEDHTETKTKGWTFPWFDDPRPALVRSLDVLVHADFTADRVTSGLQTTTNALRLVNDALRLKIDPRRAIPTLACDLANKVASFSYGTTTTKEWVKREIPELNKIDGRVIKIKNKLTHLEGPVTAQTLEVETESFTASAPKEKVSRGAETKSNTFTFSPVRLIKSAVVGALTGFTPLLVAGSIIGATPDISHTTAHSSATEFHPTMLQIVADNIVLRVGNIAFTGVQLTGRLVDAIINGTMTFEALQDEVIESSQQTSWHASLKSVFDGVMSFTSPSSAFSRLTSPLSAIPTFRSENREHVEKFVQHMAKFVGEEKFLLRIGQSLIKRSANVGLLVDGVSTSSGLSAPEIIDSPIQSVHIDKRDAFTLPLLDALALCGAVSEFNVLRRQTFDAMRAKGVTSQEAVKVLNDPAVKEVMQDTSAVTEKIKERRLQSHEKFEKSAGEILKKYESMPPAKVDELLAAPESILTEKGIPIEYAILKEQAAAEAQQSSYQDMVELTQLRLKIEKIAEDHPTAAKVLTTALHGIEWTMDKISDGLFLVGGAAHGLVAEGPRGVISGAKAGLAAKAVVGEVTVEIVDKVVVAVTADAINSAQTPTEKAAFQKTVEFFKNTSLSVFGLLGMRHFLKPKPVSKAVSAPLKKVFERPTALKQDLPRIRLDGTKAVSKMSTPELSILVAEDAYKTVAQKMKPNHFGHKAGTYGHNVAKERSLMLQGRFGERLGKSKIEFEKRSYRGILESEETKLPKSGFSRYDVLDPTEGLVVDYKFFKYDRPDVLIFDKTRLNQMIINLPDDIHAIYGVKPIFDGSLHTGKFEAVKVWSKK